MLVLILGGIFILQTVDLPQPPPTITASITRTSTPSLTSSPSATATPSATLTPRSTWTIRPKATITASPTSTNSPTVTTTRLPTLAAATPYKLNERYSLKEWTQIEADTLAQMMLEYPENLYPEVNEANAEKNSAFTYAAFAYQEALLRFPNSPLAHEWRWKLAYSLAHLGNNQAIELYTSFLQEILDQGTLIPEDLPIWFQQNDPGLTLELTRLPPRPGFLDRFVGEIKDAGIYFLLSITPDRKNVIPLTTRFKFGSSSRPRFLFSDLNHDGIEEAIVYEPDLESNTMLMQPRILNIASQPAEELPIQVDIPLDLKLPLDIELQEQASESGQDSLRLEAVVFPVCPFTIRRDYAWNGTIFEISTYSYNIHPVPASLNYCEILLEHAALTWEPAATLVILEGLAPLWPPPLDTKGRLYPEDASDALRFRAGIYQALVGKQSQAVQTLNDLVNHPTTPESQWIAAGQEFLETYQQPGDLYRACVEAASCDANAALRWTVSTSGLDDPHQVPERLAQAGVMIRSMGVFDFDSDGFSERWMTVRQAPGAKLELWMLAPSPSGARAVFVDWVDEEKPAFFFSESQAAIPIFQFRAGQGFALKRRPFSGEPYLEQIPVTTQLTTYTLDELDKTSDFLLLGGNAQAARDQLEKVLASGRFNCKTHSICDRFYYVLGLAYELNGEERQAVDTYLKLWWENRQSSYTTMARLKLADQPKAKATVSPTPNTALSTLTPTPTNATPYP